MRNSNGVIRGFGQRIADLLREDPEQSGKRLPVERATGAGVTDEPDVRRMLEHAQLVLGERAELPIGRINFINIDQIRERMGDRWPSSADRVDAIVRRTIKRHLEPADLYTPLPGHRYLISFGRLSVAEAFLRTTMITEEIRKLLVGEDFDGETLDVRAAVATVDGQTLLEHVANPHSPPAQDEPPGDPDPLADVQLVYQPMWDVRRNVVSTFMYIPAVPRRGGDLAVGRSVVPGVDDPRVLQLLDAKTMARALTDLMQLAENRRKLLLVVPLHFESVATTSRLLAYAKLCRMVPSDLQQLLIFELIDVPVGIPQSRLLDLTTMLKRYSRSVLLRLPLFDPSFRTAAETGISVVGASLSGLRLRERQLMRAFDKFCEGAHKAGLHTYIHGLRTLSLTTAAVGAGFDYVDGDIVTSVVDEPTGMYRFDARTMVRNWAIGNV